MSGPATDPTLQSQLDILAHDLATAVERASRLEQEVAELRQRLDGSGPRFAALYADFTDRFRGTTEEVTAKLRAYLGDVERLVGQDSADPDAVRVLDVGCGRGEWLDLLADVGVRAAGVDANPDFVAAGRARGLDLVHADGITHLRGLPASSLDLVTSFHLIEHLDVDTLLALFEAARHALRPGGCLLVETPNPTNLAMGACNFYLDPTHRSPLPPALTEYLVSAAGFTDVEVRPLHPDDPPAGGGGTATEQLVARALCGPRDYAVLGYRPAGAA